MKAIPTIKIEANNPLGFKVINQWDYDPSIHTHYKEDGDEFSGGESTLSKSTQKKIAAAQKKAEKEEAKQQKTILALKKEAKDKFNYNFQPGMSIEGMQLKLRDLEESAKDNEV